MEAPEITIVNKSSINPASLLKDLKGKPYLGAHESIYWFTVEHPAPEGRIITTIDFEHKAVRAEIYIGDVLVATGHSIGDGHKSLEKLETAAIRRALANVGYGTTAAIAETDDEDAAKTQARAAIAAEQIPTKVAREKMGAGKNRRLDTGEPEPAENGQKPDTSKAGKPTSLFQWLMANVKHPRYQVSEARARSIKKLQAADLLYDAMPHDTALKLVNYYATLRDDGRTENEAMAEVRKAANGEVEERA